MISLLSIRKSRRARLVTHAFFDDSDSFGSRGFLCLSGYVSDDPGWESFHKEWEALLRRYHLKRLHTSDFLAGHGEYEEIRETTPYQDRVKIVREFIAVIQKHIICGVSVGIDGFAFRQIFQEERKRPPPEEFCFFRVMKLMVSRCLIPEWQGMLPLSLIFDDSEHSMRFYKAYRAIKSRHIEAREALCSITFADDRFVGALQAADLLAWVTVKEHRRGEDAWDTDSPFRGLLQAADPVYGLLYDQEYWDTDLLTSNKADILKMAL